MKSQPVIRKDQEGAVLVMALIFLILLTLIGVAAVNSTTSGFKVVGNMQSRAWAMSIARTAIESVISTPAIFYTPAAQTVTVDGQAVSVARPVCSSTARAEGYELGLSAVTPDDTYWEVKAAVTDSITAASVNIKQGIKMRMTQGSCL